jgi:CRP-like cAMP-binding protein
MSKVLRVVDANAARRATPEDCAQCPAESLGLFSGAFRTQRAYLVDGFRIVQVAPQELLYRLGDTAEFVFILRYGLMKLVRYSAGGDERIVRLARGGDTVGLEALSGTPYRHTAVALSDTALCRVPARLVLETERSDPRFVDRVMAEMQEELEKADLFLTELCSGAAHARIARLLLHLREGRGDDACFLPMREEIGSLLGVTMETASRIVAEFRRDGLIRPLDDGQRVSLDIPRLEAIAAS